MKYLTLILLLTSPFVVKAQTNLVAGDIAIVQYNSDNPDDFSFMCLRGIDSGTLIYFTDNGWQNTGSFRNTEGILSWIAPKTYNCGDIVLVDSLGSISLSASGDQLFAYQGSVSSPVFITGFNNEDTAVWQSNATSTNTSALPSSLTNGVNAIAVYEVDNAIYKDTNSGSLGYYKSRVFSDSNFSGHNSTRQSFSGTISITSGCFLPVDWLDFSAKHENDELHLIWSTASEINNHRFEIEYSVDRIAFEHIQTVLGKGDSYVINRYESQVNNRDGYYRIKQIDHNGKYSYSDVIYVQNRQEWIKVLHTASYIEMQCTGRFSYRLIDLHGEVHRSLLTQDKAKVNKKDLMAGVYVLEVKKDRRYQYFKLIVQ